MGLTTMHADGSVIEVLESGKTVTYSREQWDEVCEHRRRALFGPPALLPYDPAARCAPPSSGPAAGAVSSIDRYCITPPEDDAAPRRCTNHPHEEAVYVAIPVTTVDTNEPATVRGWTCPRCWTHTRRSFAVAEYELEREVRR